jgi:hypothetical protein
LASSIPGIKKAKKENNPAMAYFHEKADGSNKAQPHKLRAMLKNKVGDLLSRYTLDEVLSEVAAQRPSFDIILRVANLQSPTAKGQAAETVEV